MGCPSGDPRAGWTVGGPTPASEPYVELGLANSSGGAVYNVHIDVKCLPNVNVREEIFEYVRREHEAHAWLSVIPPTHTGTYTIALPEQNSRLIDSVDVYYRDQRGKSWKRAALGGDLSPSTKPPFVAPTFDEDGPWDPIEEDGYIELQYLEDYD